MRCIGGACRRRTSLVHGSYIVLSVAIQQRGMLAGTDSTDREFSMHDTEDSRSALITRRRSLTLIGAGGAATVLGGGLLTGGRADAQVHEGHDFVADAATACTLTAEQEEGPFYVAVDDVRSDIVLAQAGLPLELTITIINTKTCKPLKHAAVDIWQCNADGVYSDEASENTTGKTYLRGVQFTDAHGRVHFTTIYPGHYAGRTTHIHAKVHIKSGDSDHTLSGGHVAHTGQMFPPDAVNTEVYKRSPYDTETATVVTHAEDRVWTEQHGSESQIRITKLGHRLSKGLAGHVTLAVNPSATPAAV
jgi:protocatechuate 3,4-dioxygenase beta subunit